ncbi:Ig-like domain-containing protein [Bdellovibrio sp. HCB2-146]|uniref:Ig-like domain-containing protein n=1 Tax=Bdellovibrio sp. HCB2-146 TaxID=3394362 RepID=UPI0039BC775F
MKTIIVLALLTVTIVSFQNCSQVAFNNPEDFTNLSSFTDTTIVETKMNTPITFNVEHSKPIVVESIKVEVEGTSINGNFEVLDEKNIQFKYTPNFGFRGRDSVRVTVKDKYQNSAILYVIANVGNSLSDFEPALAVRGMGCIQCHANIKSNIVTDFGYGNDYYFGVKPANTWWRSGGVYGDHDNKFGTMSIPADKTVHVPKASLPAFVAAATSKQTIAQYVSDLFSKSEYANTREVAVAEQSSIYIGAPTAAQMASALRLADTERSRYYKNSLDSVELSGVVDQGTFFEMSGQVECDGDLVVRGPLYIDNLNLKTTVGCRVYVIGSVFAYGPITYAAGSDSSNLQITSTKSVNFGLGSAKNNDGKYCSTTDVYSKDNSSYGSNSLTNRYSTFWTVPGNFVRQSASPKEFGDSIIAEAKLIEAKKGSLKDAACGAEGRNVSFEHVLVNAPVVQSRYVGDFKGTVIAEFSIMTLGAFKFEFDPIFKTVPVWPFLDSRTYLHVE